MRIIESVKKISRLSVLTIAYMNSDNKSKNSFIS